MNANIFNELRKATKTELEFGIAKPELTYTLLQNINITFDHSLDFYPPHAIILY